jgi:hypothetical protein
MKSGQWSVVSGANRTSAAHRVGHKLNRPGDVMSEISVDKLNF